jgi:OTU domain-containing protein 3
VPSHQTKDRASQPYAQAGEKTFQPGSVKVVMAGSGCENREKVEQVQLLSCLTDISV